MSHFHKKTTLTQSSQYLKQIDPVTHLPFSIGVVAFICEANNVAISAESVVACNNLCPFCGEEIYLAYTASDPKPPYPSNLPWNHNAFGPGESILFSFLIGGCGGFLISILPLPEGTLKYLIQIVLICSVMIVSLLLTKQPLGASLAVLWSNLIPIFVEGTKMDVGNILYIFALTSIAWIASVSISKIVG